MSMDAGGLAQMSYNNLPSIGVPGSGFASRGKGSHIQRLSFEPSAGLDQTGNGAPTPRTSRSHLLAGLRTAPKSATFPPSAPPTQLNHRTGIESSVYAETPQNARNYGAKTSVGSTFPVQQASQKKNNRNSMYALPEVLAPPEILIDEHGQDQMDPNLYAQLVATNLFLAEQQRQLQQQLANVQAATHQFNGMNLNQMNQHVMQQQFATPPITPQGMYQNKQQNMQPIITPVAGAQPGVYSVYDPVTGQQQYFVDHSAQQQAAYMAQAQQSYNHSPPQPTGTPRFQVSPPSHGSLPLRSTSPPKKSSSPPQEHAPLPPPSANAFRRGHKKASSMAIVVNATAEVEAGPRTAVPKAGVPQTPMTGLFGPGQARAGEHPIRQPRGPPALDELKAKPTAKHEGSKNFAARQRRSAVHNLVRAGMERRRAPGSGSSGSTGSITPISETGEITFSVPSDNDSDSGRSGSGSLSGRPSMGSSRGSVHGAIGSDRPSSRSSQKERSSVDSNFTAATIDSNEGSVGGSFAAVFKTKKTEAPETPRKSMLVLTSSAEKRKSGITA